jgi:hypothetical protein
MSERTPGPWAAKRLVSGSYPGHVIIWPDKSKGGLHMRRLDSFSGSFSEADAYLIAAAPELLEVLEEMLNMMDSGDEHGHSSEWYLEAHAAISKAKGGV